jgi:hypothetical protein
MKQPPIFGSKKATLAVISAALTMLLTVLPIFFPNVDPSIFQDAADFILKIVTVYLPSQAVIDVAKVWQEKNEQASA